VGMVNTPVATTLPGPEFERLAKNVEIISETQPAPPRKRPTRDLITSIMLSIWLVPSIKLLISIKAIITYKSLLLATSFNMGKNKSQRLLIAIVVIKDTAKTSYTGLFKAINPTTITTIKTRKENIVICIPKIISFPPYFPLFYIS